MNRTVVLFTRPWLIYAVASCAVLSHACFWLSPLLAWVLMCPGAGVLIGFAFCGLKYGFEEAA